jgi:uncharacterized DUF497 family protein
MDIKWNEEKNDQLKIERNIGFEDIIVAINNKKLIADIEHINKDRLNQRLLLVEIDNYIYVVPYVQDEGCVFLKTIYPSRSMT